MKHLKIDRPGRLFAFFLSLLLLSVFCISARFLPKKEGPVIIGYVGGFRGEANTDIIDALKLTHINYAFVDVQGNRAFLTNEKTDTINFRKLNVLKQINPALKILISIGGWAWSENFSDAVLTDTSRKYFAESAVDIIKKYQLDGVDIDWEYPTIPGEEGNIYRPEDKQNFTLMFKELRLELDSLQQQTGKKYLLTTAVGGFSRFIQNTEMGNAQQYLDYVNLMTYDFGGNGKAAHHTNLYPSTNDEKENSAHRAVQDYIAAGVPAEKLVMGMAFYGRGSILTSSGKPILGQQAVSRIRGGGYTFIKDTLMFQNGFEEYWDKKAKAPYLFNDSTLQFITYDNERSVKYKCKYVKKHKLGGVMFWEYSSDVKGYLLTEANEILR